MKAFERARHATPLMLFNTLFFLAASDLQCEDDQEEPAPSYHL